MKNPFSKTSLILTIVCFVIAVLALWLTWIMLSEPLKIKYLPMWPILIIASAIGLIIWLNQYGFYRTHVDGLKIAKKELEKNVIEKFDILNKTEIEKISDLEKKIQALLKAEEIHFVSRMVLIEMIKNTDPETKAKIATLMRTQDIAIPAIKWETPKEIVDIINQQNGDLFIKHIEDKRKGNK